MGKAVQPISHQWEGDQLTVVYEHGVTFVVDHIRPDHDGRLWVHLIAKVGDDVTNEARLDLMDDRRRVDFAAGAHGRDGQVDWQAHLVPVIRLAQQMPAGTEESCKPTDPDPWPVLDKTALHGLAGILTLAIDPYTEADPFAVLISLLTAFGNIVGTGAHFTVEHTKHLLRIFAVLVGVTAKGRKGTSWSTPQHIFAAIDEAWVRDRVTSGLSSGEGLIFAVRDERWEKQPIKQKGRVIDYQRVLVDEGVADKRLMIVEEEFSQALKMTSREGNILSTILRQAWDTGRLNPLTKTNPIRATNAHISIIGHITQPELLRHLTEIEMANGYANRFLWGLVRRSKKIPDPTGMPASELNPLIIRLQRAVEAVKRIGAMRRDAEAQVMWAELYDELSEGKPGLFGAITGRAEVQVMRLAAIYAAMEGTALITCEHLEAALAVWRYCEASARYIFGDSTGDPVADRMVSALQEQGDLDRTALSALFGRNLPSDRIDRAIETLKQTGRVIVDDVRNPKGGRPLTIIKLRAR